MSTATIPFILRRSFLPFCPNDVTSGGADYDYVSISTEDAVRLYFMLEKVSLTPTGDRKLDGVLQASFTKTFTAPEPSDTTDLTSFSIEGPVINPENIGDEETPVSEPALRVCTNSFLTGASEGDIISFGMEYEPDPMDSIHDEACSFALRVAYVSGEWRAYYRFQFNLGSDGYTRIKSPSNSPNPTTFVGSGTMDFAGLTFSWIAEQALMDDIPPMSFENYGLTCSTTFWSF